MLESRNVFHVVQRSISVVSALPSIVWLYKILTPQAQKDKVEQAGGSACRKTVKLSETILTSEKSRLEQDLLIYHVYFTCIFSAFIRNFNNSGFRIQGPSC